MADHWRTPPVLEGQHVQLRPMLREDGPAIVEAASDGKLWEPFFTAFPSADSIDGWMDAAFAEQSYGRSMPFVVVKKTSGQLVGTTRYLRMKSEAKRLEIGATFYAKSAQRTAVNTEAKLLLLGHAFEAMDCICVQLRTDFFNQQSQRAIERLGAKRDGILRNHTIMNGRVRDTVVYSIIANEWEGVKRNLEYRLRR